MTSLVSKTGGVKELAARFNQMPSQSTVSGTRQVQKLDLRRVENQQIIKMGNPLKRAIAQKELTHVTKPMVMQGRKAPSRKAFIFTQDSGAQVQTSQKDLVCTTNVLSEYTAPTKASRKCCIVALSCTVLSAITAVAGCVLFARN